MNVHEFIAGNGMFNVSKFTLLLNIAKCSATNIISIEKHSLYNSKVARNQIQTSSGTPVHVILRT